VLAGVNQLLGFAQGRTADEYNVLLFRRGVEEVMRSREACLNWILSSNVAGTFLPPLICALQIMGRCDETS
jgi:hypothetical protein